MTVEDADRRWRGNAIVLRACAFLLAPAAVIDPLALAPLFGLAAVAILALGGKAALDAARPLAPLALLLALLSLWAALSAAIGLGIALALVLFEAATDSAAARLILRRSFVALSRLDRGATTSVLA